MARELLVSTDDNSPSEHNEKTDVWAFGMVIYEMLTWKVPYWEKTNDVLVLMAIAKGELPKAPKDLPPESYILNELWKLCKSCWETDCTSRPTAQEIALNLPSKIDQSTKDSASKISSRPGKYCDSMPEEGSPRKQTTSFEGKVRHEAPPNAYELPTDHLCTGILVDDRFHFACERSDRTGPVASVQIKCAKPGSTFAFDFALNSREQGGYGAETNTLRDFSVVDQAEASSWLGAFLRANTQCFYPKTIFTCCTLGMGEGPSLERQLEGGDNADRRKQVRFGHDTSGEQALVIPFPKWWKNVPYDEVHHG